MSNITLSPDSRLALVSQYKDNHIVIWDLSLETPFMTLPMTDKPWRPYVSSDSEYIIVADKSGEAKVIDSWGGEVVKSVKIQGEPLSIRTGWIETLGIIESKKHLDIFDLTSDNAYSLPLKKQLIELVVVSDSKTLFATQEGSSKLFVYDIRRNQRLKEIETGLKQPNHLAMAITNTVCH